MKRFAMLGMISSVTVWLPAQQPPQNSFAPPLAKLQQPPVRSFDLQHLKLVFDVDYPSRSVQAVAVNRLRLLEEAKREIVFHASSDIRITAVSAQGKPLRAVRSGDELRIKLPKSGATQVWDVRVEYSFKRTEAARREEPGGWHWHSPSPNDPSEQGFWTRGEPDQTRRWAVTWDFPNDFTTTETHTTVPADWQVIGNGLQTADRPSQDKKRHTVVWTMKQPHATYLTSLVAGPFEIRRDKWRDVPLYYVAPRGPKPGSREEKKVGYNVFELYKPRVGEWLDYTCAHTKDMMEFFSNTLGVPYPYPKYAQTFTYSHNGGLENISATTMGLFLTNARKGHYDSDWIISHELAHQWFGDLVTCQNWGELWLNEGFAMFMQALWTRKFRGHDAYMREAGNYLRSYLFGAQEYKRPIATQFFRSPDDMFDSHSYEKGAYLLMSLKAKLGDKTFFDGLRRYLTDNRHKPVDSSDLCAAMSQAAGTDLKPWFDQWIWKPGHPVLDWSWNWDDLSQEAVVSVKQVQDTADGTPLYQADLTIGLIFSDGRMERRKVKLDGLMNEFRLKSSPKPDTVLLDPDQELLRQIRRQPWAGEELWTVLRFAPNCMDRETALNRLAVAETSDQDLLKAAKILEADRDISPAFMQTTLLGMLKRPALRSFWEGELQHKAVGRRRQALRALAQLPSAPTTLAALRAMVNDCEAYDVIGTAIRTMADLDFAASEPLIRKVAQTSTESDSREAALASLLKYKAPDAMDLILAAAKPDQMYSVRVAAVNALDAYDGDDPRIIPFLRGLIRSDNISLAFEAMGIARRRKFKELLPDLKDLLQRTPYAVNILENAIKEIESPGS